MQVISYAVNIALKKSLTTFVAWEVGSQPRNPSIKRLIFKECNYLIYFALFAFTLV